MVPWIGEQPYTKLLFWQFSNTILYPKIVGQIPDQNLNVWLFSNPGDKVQIHIKSTGQICPVVLHLFWTFSPGFENNHKFKCWSSIFPTILLENCQNNISVYGGSSIQGKKSYSYSNFIKTGSQSKTYERIFFFYNLGFPTFHLMRRVIPVTAVKTCWPNIDRYTKPVKRPLVWK